MKLLKIETIEAAYKNKLENSLKCPQKQIDLSDCAKLATNKFNSFVESIPVDITLPENATNGDVLKALFPESSSKLSKVFANSSMVDWWNDLYERK